MLRKYIFTDKKHTYKGILSSALGVIDIVAIVYAIRYTFMAGGEAKDSYAGAMFLVLIFAFAGILLGLIGKSERDKFHFFAYLGIVLNIMVVMAISGILYAGAYGL